MDIVSYAASKKIAEGAVSGVASMSVSGQTLTINCVDGTVLTMTFPTPSDGVSITDVDIRADKHLIVTLSDGNTIDAGEVPTVKGDKGDKGDTGVGLPEGGTVGQVLVKKSGKDYDMEWGEPAGGGDMLKSVYDTDNDGKVNSAENADTVDGHTVAKDVPADAKFTDTVYDDTEIRGEIADKVDKVSGKGLSTEDYTSEEKTKLAGVEASAEVNTIESITLNGTEVTPDANKNVALTVITNAVNDLVNYYLKSETYTKTEVDGIVTAIKNSRFEVVATLPTTDIKTNVIYLVPKSPSQTSNVKDEYINLDGTTSGWEKIGDTEIDLSDYVTTQILNTALAAYTTTSDLTTLLAAKQDTLTFDDAPTQNSDNPVKSGGIYAAEHSLAEKIDKVGNVSGDAETITYSDIVSIEDALAVNAKDVSIKIEPVQAGSGTPSPDNIRTISGWSSAKVTRAGKNKLPLKMSSLKSMNSSGTWSGSVYTKGGLTFSAETNDGQNVNAITINGLASERVVFYLNSRFSPPSGQYTLSKTANTSSILMVASAYNNITWIKTLAQFSSGNGTFTIDYDGYDRIEIYIDIPSGTTISNVKLYPQLELGSIATAFEPYTSNEYTIDLGGTIYGGTLDVTSGKLTVDRAYATISSFTGYNSGDGWVYQGTGGAASSSVTKMVADSLETKAIGELRSSDDGVSVNSQGILLVKNSAITNQSLENYNEYYTANPLHVVYELVTPQVIQLTPTQIRMLAGVNTVYANTGDTQVEYFNASAGNLGEVVGDVQEDTQALTNQANDMVNVLGAKNLLPVTVAEIKKNNTSNGEWSGNVFTTTGGKITFKINTTDGVTVDSIRVQTNPSGTGVTAYSLYLFDGSKKLTAPTIYTPISDNDAVSPPFSCGCTVDGTNYAVNNGAKYKDLPAGTLTKSWIYSESGSIVDKTFYPMIRLASIEDDSYEPYAKTNRELTKDTIGLIDNDFANGAVNLFKVTATSQVKNGVTFNVNDDGTITLNGTATEYTVFSLGSRTFTAGKRYKLTGSPSGSSSDTYYQVYYNGTNFALDYGSGYTFIAQDNNIHGIDIVIKQNQTVSDVVFKPMITVADMPNSDYAHYVPYAMSNRELTETVDPLKTQFDADHNIVKTINNTMNVFWTDDTYPSDFNNLTTQQVTDIAQALYDVFKKIGGTGGIRYSGLLAIYDKKASDGSQISSSRDMVDIYSNSSYDSMISNNANARFTLVRHPYGSTMQITYALWQNKLMYSNHGINNAGTVADRDKVYNYNTISTYKG